MEAGTAAPEQPAAFAGVATGGQLTDVAGGPAGWLATGYRHTGDASEKRLYGSLDGKSWSPLPVDGALASALALARVAWTGDRFVIGARVVESDLRARLLVASGLPIITAPSGRPPTPAPLATPEPGTPTGLTVERPGHVALHIGSGIDAELAGAAVCTGTRNGPLVSVSASDIGSIGGYRIRLDLRLTDPAGVTIGQGFENAPAGVEPMEYLGTAPDQVTVATCDGSWSGSATFAGLVGGSGPEMTPLPIGGAKGPATLEGRLEWTCGEEALDTSPGRLDGTLELSGALAGTFAITGECPSAQGALLFLGDGSLADGRAARVQVDGDPAVVGVQVFPAGSSKQEALIATGGPGLLTIQATSPTRGTLEGDLAMDGGPVHVTAPFTCNR